MSAASSARARPTLKIAPEPRRTEALGVVDDPVSFFKNEKRKLLDKLGDLSDVRVPLNRILVAIWVRPQMHGSIILTDATTDEDKYQGVSALVIKMGSHCYEANDAVAYVDDDRCQVDDWVMFRRGEGVRLRVYGQECMLLESERGIKMVLPRPDAVF